MSQQERQQPEIRPEREPVHPREYQPGYQNMPPHGSAHPGFFISQVQIGPGKTPSATFGLLVALASIFAWVIGLVGSILLAAVLHADGDWVLIPIIGFMVFLSIVLMVVNLIFNPGR